MKKLRVAVVGATGAVGREMIRTLQRRSFPVGTLLPLASARSVGRTVTFNGASVPVRELSVGDIPEADIALFSAGASIAREYAPYFTRRGCFVIDNSSAFRMDPDIPLVVPEVNSQVLSAETFLIANPNCSTIQMVQVLKVIQDCAGLARVTVATYQSVSGAGARAMKELQEQSAAYLSGAPMPDPVRFPHRIAFNCIPQVDVFLDNGFTKEEMKMVNETRKILEDDAISVSATCVRVPVFRAHAEAVWVETRRPLAINALRDLLSRTVGLTLVDDPAANRYPLPADAEDTFPTYVGRLRADLAVPNGIVFWVVSDNLLKGAALNAVQIAERLVQNGYCA